jgi:Domain of unknown function (DUF4352)
MEKSRSASPADGLTSRRTVLSKMAGVAAFTGVAVSGVRHASAQDATPTADSGGGLVATLLAPVTFKNVEGAEVLKLTVTKITDPFSGYNPSSPPPRGSRFLLLGVTVENVGANPFTFDPSRIFIQDGDAFVVYPSGVDLGPELAEPAITYQDIPPATTITGVIGYVLVKGVAPIRAFFAPSGDRLLLLAEFPAT